MAHFPPITPTSRSFTPGIYPQRSYRSLSGVVTKRTFGNSPSQAKLDLSFDNITKLQAAIIVAHYRQQTGFNRRFLIYAETLGDMNYMDFADNYVKDYTDLIDDYNSHYKPAGQSMDYYGVGHFTKYGQYENRQIASKGTIENVRWEYAQPPDVQSIRPNIMAVSVSLVGEIRDHKSDD